MESHHSFSNDELLDGFAVRFLFGKGRHLIATRPFAPGEIILKQDPYVSVLSGKQITCFCDFCYSNCQRPLRCSRSKLAHYCCKEHQRLAWTAGYKEECEALVRCSPRVPPPTIRMAARLLWRRARSLQQQQQQAQAQEVREVQRPGPVHVHHQPPWDSDHEGLWQLQHHWDRLDDRRKQLFAQMAIVTRQYMYGSSDIPCPSDDDGGEGATFGAKGVAAASHAAQPGLASRPGAWPGFRTVAQLLSLLCCNCHTVCDEELRPLGIALYPTGALVNHSCNPNSVQTFRGRTLLLKALTPLAPGDEVTIAYIELAATRQERREMLAESYFFDINATDAPPTPLPPLPDCVADTQAGTSPTSPPPAPPSHQAAPPSQCEGGISYHEPMAMEMDGAVSPITVTDDAVLASLIMCCHGETRNKEVMADGATAGSVTGFGSPRDQLITAAKSGPGCGGSDIAQPNSCRRSSPPGGVRPPPLLALDVSPNAQLHVYYTPSRCQPPWITDPRDSDLTCVEIKGNNGSDCDGGRSGRSQCASVPLSGGFLARLVTRQPNEPKEEQLDAIEEEEERQHAEEGMSKGGCGVGLSGRASYVLPDGADAADLVAHSLAMSSDLQHAQLHGMMLAGGRSGLDGSPGGASAAAVTCQPPSLGLSGAHSRTVLGAGPAPPHIELLAWGPWLADLVRVAGLHGNSPREGEAPSTSKEGGAPGMGQAAGPALAGSLQSLGAGSGPAAAEEYTYTTQPANTPPHPAVAALVRRCVEALQLAHQAETASGNGNAGEAIGMLQRAMKLLDGTTELGREGQQQQQHMQPGSTHNATDSNGVLSLGPSHILRQRLRSQLLKAAIDLGSSGGEGGCGPDVAVFDAGTTAEAWKVALQVARDLEPQYRLCYPHLAWPNMSLHYATLAKLEMLLGQPYRALRAASQALEGLRLTHGGPSSGAGGQQREGGVVEQVVRTAREAEAELQARAQGGAKRWGERCQDEL
ncbi:hypothetical protein VaNZ11_003682 [Volvox africanus]|uniref:SET domain-containing protein n=1 Tax=Volvox africanus TaxID=51714 RepID=A0ABQ5RUW9_9CHLO|nr:hypothetical protein VaNZ11_003682 [Volvox africanus]